MKNDLRTAYFAGIIDGEGSFGIWSLGKKKCPDLCLTVGMTCKKTIYALAKHFGCGKVRHIAPRKKGWKPQYIWRVKYNTARNILVIIRPYLITKQKQADAILSIPPRKRGRPRKVGAIK
ncbi:MAG TPA: hypothetical protein ENH82_19485 [bacterium]|nr:hypothetical protein [bacterium]